MDGRDLCDLLDIYDPKNLITSPTRTTEKTTAMLISFLQTTGKEYYHRTWLMSKSVTTPSYTQFYNSPQPDFDLEKFAWEDLKFDSDAFLQDLHNAPFNVMEFPMM